MKKAKGKTRMKGGGKATKGYSRGGKARNVSKKVKGKKRGGKR